MKKKKLTVRGIDVSSIISETLEKTESDYSKLIAQKELVYRLKTIARKKACTIGELSRVLKKLRYPYVTRNLENFLKKTPKSDIKELIKEQIITTFDDYVGALVLKDHWKCVKKSIFTYFYYSSDDYVDVYSLETKDLPLYVSNTFESEENRQDFMRRLESAD